MAKRIIGNPTITPMAIPDYEQDNPLKADYIKNKPTKLSQFENDVGYLTEHQDITGKADKEHIHGLDDVYDGSMPLGDIVFSVTESIDSLWVDKSDKSHSHDSSEINFYGQSLDMLLVDVTDTLSVKADRGWVADMDDTGYNYQFQTFYNVELRFGELETISFTFGNGEYAPDYISGLSFDSGATPTAIDYTDSGILNWVGTDCTNVDGLSIFQPSANTHYDIVFYFNGSQFIGLVNGFVPSTGNEAV